MPYESRKPAPDFARLHEELQRHSHLTLQLAWEEYRQTHSDGYTYSRFCELYQPPMAESERRDFLEICEDRYQLRSMILTSQRPVAQWARADRGSHPGRQHSRPAGA